MRFSVLPLLVVFALFGLLVAPAQAVAQDDSERIQKVEALSAEGAELFNADKHEEAIDRFTKAYDLEPVPVLLFNIARCYEALEKWDDAEEYYQKFVRSPDTDSDARELAMDRIDSVRGAREAELEMKKKEEEARAAKEAKEAEEKEEPEIEEVDPPDMLPAYASLGAGVGLLAGGAAMGLMARSNADTMTDSSLAYDERLDARSSARTQGIVADVFYVSGVAATAAGVYLFMSARRSGSDLDTASARTLLPFADGDSAGVGLHFDF